MSKAIIAVAGKGGVGKTSLSATIVRCLVERYPDKKILKQTDFRLLPSADPKLRVVIARLIRISRK